jgi:hypothetical protein
MRRAWLLLGLLALLLTACGKYGPPVRTRPEPEAPAAATPNAGAADANADEEEQEKPQ